MSKKKFSTLLLLPILPILFSGCLYSKIIRPLDGDVDETTLGTKVGKSTSRGVGYLFAWGDSGVAAAAKNGGLTTVRHLDVETYVLLFGLYTEVTTIAYGD